MEQPVLSMAKRIREKVPAYTGSKPWLDLKWENELLHMVTIDRQAWVQNALGLVD